MYIDFFIHRINVIYSELVFSIAALSMSLVYDNGEEKILHNVLNFLIQFDNFIQENLFAYMFIWTGCKNSCQFNCYGLWDTC